MGAEWVGGALVACTLLYITQWRGIPFEVHGRAGGWEDERTIREKLRKEREERKKEREERMKAEKREKELQKKLADAEMTDAEKMLGIGPLDLCVRWKGPPFQFPLMFGSISSIHACNPGNLRSEKVKAEVEVRRELKWKLRRMGRK
eukprot:TRINITY_DN16841_c0_g1_i1.p1 TRINITY_DN16841_c0_g1~~TRINITY_DN16841_c0_g1_i1.p1  ORF type:complete len:147 (-),score=35.58 TRINITY_DN16841_c0_g1_i1:350-790(-)